MTANRNRLRAFLIGLPLAAAVVYAALNWFTLEEEEIWIGARDKAVEDPYLAYGRLLERMGVSFQRPKAASALDHLPARGTLVLGARRLAYMTPVRINGLRDWVEHGGHLVVEAEREAIDDPLLEALGIQRVFPERDPAGGFKAMKPGDFANANAVLEVDWPELGKPLRGRLGSPFGGLRDTRVRTGARELRQGERVVALSVPGGEGRVTVLQGFGLLRNGSIGDYDHAQIGWRLASLQSPAVLYLRMTSPPLLEWVMRDAWPVLMAAALLLVLWLARIIPRFGPLQPDPQPNRRSLLEHVVASGRFLWSRGAGAELVEAVRERASRAARRRGLSTKSIGSQAPGTAIARLDANAFTQRIAALQKIEEQAAQKGKK